MEVEEKCRRKILNSLRVEVSQAGFSHYRVSCAKEVGASVKMILEGEVNQENN